MNQGKFLGRIVATAFIGLASLALLDQVVGAEVGRQRVLLDSGWRFFRGEPSGAASAESIGIPIDKWRCAPSAAGVNADAASIAQDIPETQWKDVKIGDDVFKNKPGFMWFTAVLPKFTKPGNTLHFASVDDNATVYLNGFRLLHHEGWQDSFDVPLTSHFRVNSRNRLEILVENLNGPGGIAGPVLLRNGTETVVSGPAKLSYDDSNWRKVHLPHDYIVEGTFSPTADGNHGYLPIVPAWYRKSFSIPASDKGKSLWVDFDGVYRDSNVWLNGHYLGLHQSGYTSFRYDISSAAIYGGKNVLSVSVDPRRTEGWWYEGGGIYRHVWLNVANRIHVAPWGTFVSSQLPEPSASGKSLSSLLSIQTKVVNASTSTANCIVVSTVLDSENHMVAVARGRVSIRAGVDQTVFQHAPVVHPKLWSLQSPYLYHLQTTVQMGGQLIDTTTTNFGIRTIRFDPASGFYLNGKSVKIQGVCNHQDFIGVGIAVPDTLEAWRVRKLKALGANAWRMSHNPPTPELLDACDRLGMLVMDENRKVGDSPSNLADLTSMIKRDRNHPSIIIWSMCNEEWNTQGTQEGAVIFSHMMQAVRKFDTTRPISCAQSNTSTWGHGFSTVEDLQGCNYGGGTDYDRVHATLPKLPVFGSETASTLTTRGEYANDKVNSYVSSYNMTDGAWKPIADRSYMAGGFVWTGFDYKGEPTPYTWPCINSHFGILDMCGFPKDNYYYYQSWWKTKPIVHLMPHWNWAGHEGENIRVIAFSNADRVELFLNGTSLGSKKMPRYEHLEWTVPYQPGILSAKGYSGTGRLIAADIDETTGPPAAVRLVTDRKLLSDDGEDIIPVEVDVVDSQGRIVPTASNEVQFKVSGSGSIAGVGNGNPSDHSPDKGKTRRAFNGKCMVLVGSVDRPGPIELSAISSGLKPAKLELRALRDAHN